MFFFALLALVPKRLTVAFTAQDGEVPSVGEVGKRRHRIILRVRPCVSRPTLDRCHGHCTARTNHIMSSSLAQEPQHTSSASRQTAQSTHTGRQACAQRALATTPVDVFFALVALVPKRLTAAFTAQDGEVPSVGEVGKRRHRIICEAVRVSAHTGQMSWPLHRAHLRHCRIDQLPHQRKHQSFTLDAKKHCTLQHLIVRRNSFLRPVFHALPLQCEQRAAR